MKFGGITVQKPKPKYLCIPHQDLPDGQLVLQIAYVPDVDVFITLFPQPVPKSVIQRPGQSKPIPNTDDPNYKKEMQAYYLDMQEWCVLAAIDAHDKNGARLYPVEDLDRDTVGPTFESIDIADRTTLRNWEKEFANAGFATPIIERIKQEVYARTGLNQGMIDKLTDSFLSSRGQSPADNR